MKKKEKNRFFSRYASLLFSFNGDSNSNKIDLQTLHEKCPYLEFFWSAFSCMRTRITPNTDTFYAFKEFFNNAKMNKMLLRIGFVTLLIFCFFSKVIQLNIEVKNYFTVIKKIDI